MNTLKRVILFGAVSGLLWSAVPIWFSERSRTVFALYVPAGIITGMLISLALCRPLRNAGYGRSFALGVLALPLSGMFFGFFVGLLMVVTGYPSGDSVAPSHNPLVAIYTGILYAYMTVVLGFTSYLGFLLFPLAVATTWLLRFFIRTRPTVAPK